MPPTTPTTAHDQTVDSLRARIPPGTVLYAIERKRSRTGHHRVIDFILLHAERSPVSVSWEIATVTGVPFDQTLNGVILHERPTPQHLIARLSSILFTTETGVTFQWL